MKLDLMSDFQVRVLGIVALLSLLILLALAAVFSAYKLEQKRFAILETCFESPNCSVTASLNLK